MRFLWLNNKLKIIIRNINLNDDESDTALDDLAEHFGGGRSKHKEKLKKSGKSKRKKPSNSDRGFGEGKDISDRIVEDGDVSSLGVQAESNTSIDHKKKGELFVLKKEEIEKHKNDEYLDPTTKLIVLGDLIGEVGGRAYRLNEEAGQGKFRDGSRLGVLRELVKIGFDVSILGIEVNLDGDEVRYSTDINKIDRQKVLDLVKELEAQKLKFDENNLSDDFKIFMNENLDKFKKAHDYFYRTEGTKSDVIESQKNAGLIWYDGIGADLWYATMRVDHISEKNLAINKKEALERLKIHIPNIEQSILGHEQESKVYKLHWASRAFKPKELTDNPWPSKAEAKDFMKNTWNIGIDEDEDKNKDIESVTMVEKPEIVLSEENPILQELKRDLKSVDQKTKWETKMSKIKELPAKEQENKFLMLVALGRIQRNKRFLDKDIDSDGKIAEFWADYRSRLTDLGVEVV